MAYRRIKSSKQTTGILLIIASVFALGFAWFVQHIMNMAPCGLCLLERWPYRILFIVGVLIVITSEHFSRWLILLAGLVLFVSMIFAAVHIGVEQKWWDSPLPECRSVFVSAQNIAEQFINMPDRPHKPCDAPTYLFDWLPISLTIFNGLYSLVLFGFVLLMLGTRKTKRFLS